jgi:hypothetical protein
MNEGTVTEPFEVDEVVEFLILDFLEVVYYICPVLHCEISLMNSATYGLCSLTTAIQKVIMKMFLLANEERSYNHS